MTQRNEAFTFSSSRFDQRVRKSGVKQKEKEGQENSAPVLVMVERKEGLKKRQRKRELHLGVVVRGKGKGKRAGLAKGQENSALVRVSEDREGEGRADERTASV